jgi:hypothetical protein
VLLVMLRPMYCVSTSCTQTFVFVWFLQFLWISGFLNFFLFISIEIRWMIIASHWTWTQFIAAQRTRTFCHTCPGLLSRTDALLCLWDLNAAIFILPQVSVASSWRGMIVCFIIVRPKFARQHIHVSFRLAALL